MTSRQWARFLMDIARIELSIDVEARMAERRLDSLAEDFDGCTGRAPRSMVSSGSRCAVSGECGDGISTHRWA